jgi:arginase family enzyme
MAKKNPNPAYGKDLGAYAGIPTFMRQPASRDLEGVDVAIVGIPFDSGATSFRSGARMGPRKIREHTMGISASTSPISKPRQRLSVKRRVPSWKKASR